jgi:hypothetical protein
MKATRQQVYAVVDGERDYQDTKWTPETTASGGRHENILEWLTYMKNYCEEAINVMCRREEPFATEFALHTTRKVTALGVAAMENCGVMPRSIEGARPVGYTEG